MYLSFTLHLSEPSATHTVYKELLSARTRMPNLTASEQGSAIVPKRTQPEKPMRTAEGITVQWLWEGRLGRFINIYC